MRFQPPGPGLAPSGIGRPAELVGPLSRSRRLPRVTSANAGGEARQHLEVEELRVEGDGCVDVVDHVADADHLVELGHGFSPLGAQSAGVRSVITASRKPMRVSSSEAVAWKVG